MPGVTYSVREPDGTPITGESPIPVDTAGLHTVLTLRPGMFVARSQEGAPPDVHEKTHLFLGGQWFALTKVESSFAKATSTVPASQTPSVQLGAQQQRAFQAAADGRSVFITGPGGTGKSVVLREIIDFLRSNGRRVAVAGSTGMAAVNIGGMTIHSTLGTGLGGSRAQVQSKMSSEMVSKAADRLSRIDTVVLDEVSMLTGDYLDMMDWWLNLTLGYVSPRPFGGLQLILCGDFLQLPPVVKSTDAVEKKYAFQAAAWSTLAPEVHALTHNYRQESGDDFRKHLSRLRRGKSPDDTLGFFNERVGAKISSNGEPTTLFSLNREVNGLNLLKLESLPGQETSYQAAYDGDDRWIEALQKMMPCDDVLDLKPGAEVVLKRNDPQGRYVNGSRGVVVACDPAGVRVKLRNGDEVVPERATWEMKNADERVLASVSQIPLKLAWALTVHSCQGMTLDDMVFDPASIFDRAMAYVALSRVRTIDGLSLRTPLRSRHVRASKVVMDWYRAMKDSRIEEPA